MPKLIATWSAAASAAALLGGAAAAGGAGAGCSEGQCPAKSRSASSTPVAGGENLLLQVSGRDLLSQSVNSSGPSVTGSGCGGMPDVKHHCSSDKCLVLADDMRGLSCDHYCARSGRSCLAAWEEEQDNCEKKESLRCDQTYRWTSDLLCHCSEGLVPLLGRSLSEMTLVWSDEFEGNSVDTANWGYVTGGGGFGNRELQHYTHHSAQVKDGTLRITAKCENYGDERYTSAKLTTEKIATWGPGHRIEVRAKAPTAKGTWPAIWMLPADGKFGNWPSSGEIDIMETVGCTEGKAFGTVHTGAYNHMHDTQAYGTKKLEFQQWHTYAIQWTDSGIQWFIDDEQFAAFAPTHHNSERWPFGEKFYLILNLAVGGSWGGICIDKHGPSCSWGSEFHQGQVLEVDYARVYKL